MQSNKKLRKSYEEHVRKKKINKGLFSEKITVLKR